jgi:hypothetical protein
MTTAQPTGDEKQVLNARERNEQLPSNTYVTKVYFDSNSSAGDLVRIVVMSDHAVSSYVANREYHHGNTSVSIDRIESFTLRSGSLETTQASIGAFTGSMPMHLETAQAASWSRAAYTPTGAHNRLFKAVDPDDSTKMIGVLIEQDAMGRLAKITWYKTQEARAIFANTPTALAFEMVKDEAGAPSLDPNSIAGWTWYHTTSIALGT